MRYLALLLFALPAPGEDGLASPDYQTRRKAVVAAAGRPELLDRLLEIATSDPNANIRGFAAEALGAFRGNERVFPVLARMARDEDHGPRMRALVALGAQGDPRARATLLAGLKAGRGKRAYAAKGLGLLGDPETFEPVAKLLLAHLGDPYLTEMAPEALVRISKADGLAFLRKHFAALPTAAAKVLGRHPDEKTRTMMEDLLKSNDRVQRLAALQVLAEFADRRSTPALLAHLGRRPEERAETVAALGRAKDPKAAVPLIAALRAETDVLVKLRLVEALGRLGDKRALDVLKPLLDDTTLLAQPRRISAVHGFPWNTRVQSAAAWAFLTIRDGKDPFPLSETSRFPDGEPPPHVAAHIAAARGP